MKFKSKFVGNKAYQQGGQSRKGQALNTKDPVKMKGALDEFMAQKEKLKDRLSVQHLAEAWQVPNSTLRRRVLNGYKSAVHASG